MTKIPGWGAAHLALMLRALTWYKPTTMDEWTSSADAQAVLLSDAFFFEEDAKGSRLSKLKKDERVDVVLEKAPAKFLQRVFDATIAAPEKQNERPPFLPAEAKLVIELDAILKKAAEVVEEKKPAAAVPAP